MEMLNNRYLKFIDFKGLSLWDVKRYFWDELNFKFKKIELKEILSKANIEWVDIENDKEYPILWVRAHWKWVYINRIAKWNELTMKKYQKSKADLLFYDRVISEYDAGIDTMFFQAPVVIITHADLSITSCPLEDASIASYQMMLMAQSLGLGTCYIGNFYPFANESPAIRELLAIHPENQILMTFTLGYPTIRFQKLIDRDEPEVQWLWWIWISSNTFIFDCSVLT